MWIGLRLHAKPLAMWFTHILNVFFEVHHRLGIHLTKTPGSEVRSFVLDHREPQSQFKPGLV